MRAQAVIERDWGDPSIGRRPSYRANLQDGPHAGVRYILENDEPTLTGRTVTVDYEPEDQFARIVWDVSA